MLLSELLDAMESKKAENFRDGEVTGLAYDSREVKPGDVFFCIKGLVTDGHLFAAQAVRNGASAVVVEKDPEEDSGVGAVLVKVPDTRRALALCSTRFYGRPADSLRLVGITGTNGKTTTAFLVERACMVSGMKVGLIGTVENHIGDTVEPVTRTTPESLDLQRLLRRMVDAGVEVVAMEVSSHALELSRVVGCHFDVVIFTNLTRDHLDFHLSLEDYFSAKRRLFVDEEYGDGRRAVINVDDDFGRKLIQEIELPSTTYGVEGAADVRGRDVVVSGRGNRFSIEYRGRVLQCSTVLKGKFNVYNCLAAAGACFLLGLDDESIVRGLGGLKGVPGRFESIDCGQDFNVIVDYAHTPDGVRSLLEACREVSEGRVILVVGCGGDRDRSKRPLMGRVGVELSDFCVITSDNPRTEEPGAIIEMILEGVRGRFSRERYAVEVDRRQAIFRALASAETGDLVVIAGKGHESGQVFGDMVVPFDDRQVARECLEEITGEECETG